jgi:hypothetical protein
LQKALILLLIVFLSGCSSLKKASEGNDISVAENEKEIINKVEANNLLYKSFYITKGSVEIKSINENRKLLFTLKHNQADQFLLVLRNNMGIEGARIYLSDDTLLINDRINKKLMYGKASDIQKITGIPLFFKSLLLGDKIEKASVLRESLETKEGKIYLNQYKEGFTGRSLIDIKEGKIKYCSWNKGPGTKEILIKYSKFNRDYRIPGSISFEDSKDSVSVLIKINKIDMAFSEKIEFIPGAGYKTEELK